MKVMEPATDKPWGKTQPHDVSKDLKIMLKVTQEIKVSSNTLKCFLAMQLYTNFQETSGQMQPSKDFLRN